MGKGLTVRTLENIQPGKTRREIADGLRPGLYFVVQPSGATSWAVRYRHAGVPRKLTLGAYPALSLTEARERSGEALRAVAQGRDPATEKRSARQQAKDGPSHSDTIPAIVEMYLSRHVRPNLRSAADIERMFKKEIATPWAKRTIHEITRRDVVELLDRIVDRGSPYTANRAFGLIRKLMSWAVERGIIQSSPCVGLRLPSVEISRDRILTDDELRLFWRATESTPYPFGPFLQLLLLTGQRRDEVAGMRRSELNLDSATWMLPKERTKNNRAHEIPLPASAVQILRSIPIIAGSGDLIFSTTGETHISGYSKAKERLDAAMVALAKENGWSEIPDWRLHDLRRTVASGMARLGINLPVIEKVLNHVSGSFRGIVGVYQRHSFADEKRTALGAWARFVEATVAGEKVSNVVRLEKAS